MVTHPERILSLCAGGGAFDLGVHMAIGAARTVGYVEHEAYAAACLVARMEEQTLDDAPLWSDLKTFRGRPWRGRVDLVIGGYPCQPFSVAGKKLGEADPRHLWPDVFRIVREVQPRRCFFENVGGHLRLGYFDVVRPDLESVGYRVEEILVEAANVGASHKRERLFIMADCDSRGRREQPIQAAGRRHADRERGALADAGSGQLEGRRSRRRARPRSAGPPVGDTGDQAIGIFPPGPDDPRWVDIVREHPELAPAIESDLCLVADGMADLLDHARAERVSALRLTGNGVVPLQAAIAFRILERRMER